MKKLLSFLLVAMLVFTMIPFSYAEEDTEVTEEAEEERLNSADYPQIRESDFVTTMNGEEYKAKMYTVTRYFEEGEDQWTRDYVFVRLRDMAAMLNGTDGQFGIDFNNETKVVNLIPGEGYEPRDTDLIERENDFNFVEKEAFFEINGTVVEKPLDTIIVGKEYYVQLYSLRTHLGCIYRSILDGETKTLTVHPSKSDVATIGEEDLKAKFVDSDYTMLFIWAPW